MKHKYRIEKLGVAFVEAESEEDARDKGEELTEKAYNWRDVEVEQWD